MTETQRFSPQQLARRYDPAFRVVELFGGFTPMAKALGLEPSTVFRWCQSRATTDGTGGRIPHKHWAPILLLAARRSIRLTQADLLAEPTQRVNPYREPADAAQ